MNVKLIVTNDEMNPMESFVDFDFLPIVGDKIKFQNKDIICTVKSITHFISLDKSTPLIYATLDSSIN